MRDFRRVMVFVFLMLVTVFGSAQETIKVMHYNLLYYGLNYDNCTRLTNYIVDKNQNLAKIIKYVQPDIFTVNEMDGQGTHPESDEAGYLLDNALNIVYFLF